jgi:hypothetical protein
MAYLNLDCELKTYTDADYYTVRLMKNLLKLVKEEDKLGNFELSAKRAIQWLKLYSLILPSYKSDQTIHGNYIAQDEEQTNDSSEHYNWIIKHLNVKNYDKAVNVYCDGRVMVVSNKFYNIVNNINVNFSEDDRWEVFTSLKDVTAKDGIKDSVRRDKLITNILRCQHKALILHTKTNNIPFIKYITKMC